MVIFPLLPWLEAPEAMFTSPPGLMFEVAVPAEIKIDPPFPTRLDITPTSSSILPEPLPTESPVLSRMPPDVVLDDVPVANKIEPEAPDTPPFAVFNVTLPLDAAAEIPPSMMTLPPVWPLLCASPAIIETSLPTSFPLFPTRMWIGPAVE